MASGGQNHAVTATHRGAGQTSDGAIRQGRFWWIAVLRGALALLFGAATLASPRDRAMLADFLSATQRSGRRPLRRNRAMASVFKRVKEFTQSPQGEQLKEQVKEQAGKPENRRKLKEFGKRYIKRR
jgi:hypothetical protein